VACCPQRIELTDKKKERKERFAVSIRCRGRKKKRKPRRKPSEFRAASNRVKRKERGKQKLTINHTERGRGRTLFFSAKTAELKKGSRT